ncbi:hypothetical protein [Sedimentibacter sp. MB31-C6]|uniref:hypothetical protein n=1 Tax=Sedimentibacter sp. MB31-C6 TaxID=3109366 RepID=UPI002DDC96C6|nr:hypothetical protein [Sedimentibacter sp. MB36-C1]WSI03206.1 hypothetical protein U8307_09135 [Sedimentibacter sp. MB36-C1]
MDNVIKDQRLRDWTIDIITDRMMRNRGSNVIRVNDALIENVNIRSGLVTISYGVLGEFNVLNMQVVTLVIGRDTIIRDQFGQPMLLRDLREGMRVDAVFSVAMTRSIPPQSTAYSITVLNDSMQSSFTEGRVMDVDLVNSFLYTGDPFDIYSQMRFIITDSTNIRDRRGRIIRLRNIRPGDFVRIEHANFMTMSIPPQTTAFDVQVL